MIMKLLEKAFDFLLGPIQPTPVSEPLETTPEPPPDPRKVAAEMRACAAWLHRQADRLDPLVVPEFHMPPAGLLPPGWNTVMDESGDSGGKIKRKGSDIELGKTKENEVLNRIFDAHPGEGEIHLNPDEIIALMEAVRANKGAKGRL
jgi:hypothetical protein